MMTEDKKVFAYRGFFSGRFLFSAFILCLAAVGLRPCLHYLKHHYAKEKIAANRPLKEFDIFRLPSYRQGWTKTDIAVIDDIETDEYIIIKLKRKEKGKAPSEIALFVTYYSDPASKVPHTPDVCYRQGGAIVEKMENIDIDIPNLPSWNKQVKARMLIFKMPAGNKEVVIFSFCAEGVLRHTREQTRLVLGMPGNNYTYFSKMEVAASFEFDADPGPAIAECKRLYAEVLPVLLTEYFPTKEQLKRH